MHSIIAAGVVSTMTLFSPPVKPLTPERVQELVKKLETPQRGRSDGSALPVVGPPLTRSFRLHYEPELVHAGPEIIDPLVRLFEDKTKSTQARANAAVTLCEQLRGMFKKPDPRVIAALRAAIADSDPGVRENTLGCLGLRGINANRGIPNSRPVLQIAMSRASLLELLPSVLKATADEDEGVAMEALEAVFFLGETGTGLDELLACLKRKEAAVKAKAIMALGEIGRGDPRVLPIVLSYLDDRDQVTFDAAVGAVSRYGAAAKAAVPKLIAALKDQRWMARYPEGTVYPGGVVGALGSIGPDAKEALPYVVTLPAGSAYSSRLHQMAMVERIDAAAGKKIREEQRISEEEFKRFVEFHSRKAPPPPPLPSM